MLRTGWRCGDVEEGMEVGSCRGEDGGGKLFRRGWRWGGDGGKELLRSGWRWGAV